MVHQGLGAVLYIFYKSNLWIKKTIIFENDEASYHAYNNGKRMNKYAIHGRPLILWGGGQFHILHRPAIIWKLRNFCPVFSDNFGWTIKPTLFILIKMYTKDPTKTTCSFSSIFLTRLFFEYLHISRYIF